MGTKVQGDKVVRREGKSVLPGQSKKTSHGSVGELRTTYGLPRKLLAELTGYSERAIVDWEKGKTLSDPSALQMTEVVRLCEGLSRVMKREFVARWLQSPNEALRGFKPVEVISRGEGDRVWRLIFELESGAPG